MNGASRWILPVVLAPLSILTVLGLGALYAREPFLTANPWLILVVFLPGLALHMIWYFVAAQDLQPFTRTRWSPGLWTFLLMFPIAGLVSIYHLSEEIRRAQVVRGVPGIGPVGVFLWNFLPFSTLPLALPPFVNFHGVFVAQRQVNRVLRGLAPEPYSGFLRFRTGRVVPEVLPMPASGFFALLFGWASVPLGLTGPAGVLAGVAGLFFRSRFSKLEAAVGGHRGAGLVGKLPWVAVVGIAVGLGVTAAIVAGLLAVVAGIEIGASLF